MEQPLQQLVSAAYKRGQAIDAILEWAKPCENVIPLVKINEGVEINDGSADSKPRCSIAEIIRGIFEFDGLRQSCF